MTSSWLCVNITSARDIAHVPHLYIIGSGIEVLRLLQLAQLVVHHRQSCRRSTAYQSGPPCHSHAVAKAATGLASGSFNFFSERRLHLS